MTTKKRSSSMTSVALCTYNGERFLRQQLESIADQTVLPMEMVVCDDGSNDGTYDILSDFIGKAPFPVMVCKNETNLGSTKNFEKAISLCSGEIIALCDQDDVWKPHKLEILEAVLVENPKAGYAFSNALLVEENLSSIGYSLWESVGFIGKIKEEYLNGNQFQCFTKQHIVTGATMAFRSEIGKFSMPFPTEGDLIHDGWIAFVSTSIGAYGISIEEPLIYYRQHSDQQIGAPNEPKISKNITLLGMYRELKKNHNILFDDWEKRGVRTIGLIDVLLRLKKTRPTPALDKNIEYLLDFKKHFANRRRILTSRNFNRYGWILKETLSGRYSKFSDSWRSIFRDIFL